ncbi:hypothetical protein TNCV_3638641 [Trichonephila clavipes]|nr:hypothetical protein TNCV_3638641 [Trichonephila clavipes]
MLNGTRPQILTRWEFQIQIVEDILHKWDDIASGQKNPDRPPIVGNPTRLTERYFISHMPDTPAKHFVNEAYYEPIIEVDWLFIYDTLRSNTRDFEEGSRNFKPGLSRKEDIYAGILFFKFVKLNVQQTLALSVLCTIMTQNSGVKSTTTTPA